MRHTAMKHLDNATVQHVIYDYMATSAINSIAEDVALSPELAKRPIFEAPLLAFGSTTDELFLSLKNEGVIGPHFVLPTEWLPSGKTIISIFFPFAQHIIQSNAQDMGHPSHGWLHGRIEGQMAVSHTCRHLVSYLQEHGYEAVFPVEDKRFKSVQKKGTGNFQNADLQFTSNWSERHVAHICGLGTFGLSKGLITEKGIAGRLGSVITNAECDITHRKYKDIYEYCSKCGKCIKNCDVNAISFEKGKQHEPCVAKLHAIKEIYKPRYGCGKCQIHVPCATRKPHPANIS